MTNMTSKITKGKVKPTDSVTIMLYKKFDLVSKLIILLCAIFVIHLLLQINPSTTLGVVSRILNKDHFAIVTDAPLKCKITFVGSALLPGAAYAQGRVKSVYIYICVFVCVCVGKKHGCLLSYRSKIATK